jgi:hypothetical protein
MFARLMWVIALASAPTAFGADKLTVLFTNGPASHDGAIIAVTLDGEDVTVRPLLQGLSKPRDLDVVTRQGDAYHVGWAERGKQAIYSASLGVGVYPTRVLVDWQGGEAVSQVQDVDFLFADETTSKVVWSNSQGGGKLKSFHGENDSHQPVGYDVVADAAEDALFLTTDVFGYVFWASSSADEIHAAWLPDPDETRALLLDGAQLEEESQTYQHSLSGIAYDPGEDLLVFAVHGSWHIWAAHLNRLENDQLDVKGAIAPWIIATVPYPLGVDFDPSRGLVAVVTSSLEPQICLFPVPRFGMEVEQTDYRCVDLAGHDPWGVAIVPRRPGKAERLRVPATLP